MRDAYPEFATDPSDEEIARDWTLTTDDRAEVLRCRGDGNRHRFAVQLCALRASGRFVDDFATMPVRIANHVGHQLGLPPTLFMEPPDRYATAAEHSHRIREYLDYRPFDDEAQERLRQWLSERAADGVLSSTLVALAIPTLRAWKVELPARSTLERMAGALAVRGEEAMWTRIYERLPPAFCAGVDGLLSLAKGEHRSTLFDLKQYPPDARPATITEYIERYELLRSVGAEKLDLSGVVGAEVMKHLADFGRRYDVDDLKRFAPAKRYALVACFLVEAQKTILDHIVDMHREYLTGMSRRARNHLDQRHRDIRQRASKGLSTLLRAMDIILDGAMPQESRVLALYMEVDEAKLREAVTSCRELDDLSDHGYFEELLNRHSHLKRYLPAFLALPFRIEPGSEVLLSAIELGRRLSAGARLPEDAPIGFATGIWRAAVSTEDGGRDRRLWELALAFAMRDALRSGDLYLAESRNHVSFWNLVHSTDDWQKKRTDAYEKLKLPADGNHALDRLRAELEQAARDLSAGLGSNPFATLRDGRLEYCIRCTDPVFRG